MGVKPPLPAPTESSTLQTSGGSVTGTDLATDVSRRTDHTSLSIPEDGSPVIIPIKRKKEKRDRSHEGALARASHQSQTSLLIEYFEGGKGPNVHARPSVRVKVTPSAARKIKDTSEHIQITEAGGARKPSYTRRISLGPRVTGDRHMTESADERSLSSYASAADDSSLAGRHPPVEIEFLDRDHGSDLSAASAVSVARQQRYVQHNLSEISSMPPDSMVEGNTAIVTPRRNRSRSLNRDEAPISSNMLKTPSRRKSRSLSRERLTQKVIEKLGNNPGHNSSRARTQNSKTRSRSVSNEHIPETSKSGKHRPSRHHHEDGVVSGVESGILTNSQLSPRRKSGDQYSFRSGTSKSSINNPKLLETVEDAIRRLILPQLATLKHEQRMQHNRNNFEREHRDSVTSGGGSSHVELIRRVSKHASAPDVSIRPKVVLNRDENNAGTVLSSNSIRGKNGSMHEQSNSSASDRSFERDMSEETVIRTNEKDPRRRSHEAHQLRDVAGVVGGAVLTSAALEYHDAKAGKRHRKRRGSRSLSRSASNAESVEEIFERHEVPPMPMRSEIYSSELTRDSILSARTEESSSSSTRQRAEIREVSRGSPREVLSPTSRTPTRTPVQLRKGLPTHHSNLSRGDLSAHKTHSNTSLRENNQSSVIGELEFAEPDLDDPVHTLDRSLDRRDKLENRDKHAHFHRVHDGALSPIQSVSSLKEESNFSKRHSLHPSHSFESLSSSDRQDKRLSGLSIKSLSSAASTNIARSNRPKGINLESDQDVLDQHANRDSSFSQDFSGLRDSTVDDWYQQQHEQNDRYRESYENSNLEGSVEPRHMTNYPNDSLDFPHLNEGTAIKQVPFMSADREYVQTPVAVESAVASLLDPSIISERSKIGSKQYFDHLDDHLDHIQKVMSEQNQGPRRGINIESDDQQFHQQNASRGQGSAGKSSHPSVASSPRRSVAESLDHEEERVVLGANSLPVLHDPMPEPGYGLDSESDLNTNPSIIQGPLLDRAHWPYQPSPHQSQGGIVKGSNDNSAQASLRAVAEGILSGEAGLRQDQKSRNDKMGARIMKPNEMNDVRSYRDFENIENDDFGSVGDAYMGNQPIDFPPSGKLDEGYMSAPPAAYSPEPKLPSAGVHESYEMNGIDDLMADEDPFFTKSQARHMSANSHGMPSPLYDSATGGGIDRIHSKDIVALMDHLTVRDAQRNARDTEILVTLVRSAAEMRNSFEDMKRFIADQDEMLIDTGNKQHDRTIQKMIGGPRPQPFGAPRTRRRSSVDDEHAEDLRTKRRNIFRRALKGLGGRSSNDLGKIEEMLNQLLGDVEVLKAAQDNQLGAHEIRPVSAESYDNSRAAGPSGYEPEGQAGTSSTGNHSGYFSNPPSRQTSRMKGNGTRRESQNRISTVMEGDEELDTPDQNASNHRIDNDQEALTPTREFLRSGSVPLGTPPQVHIPTGAQSNEHTPKTGTDRSRRHRSSNSSFFPKISRWSKTTASSVGENLKGAGRRERPLSEASRSGSEGHYQAHNHYDAQGGDRLRSNDSLEREVFVQADRPASPLIPSQVSEKPKYQAQRDSLNLQHPQPRMPGHRYHHQLESQAHNFGSPISPSSDQWGSNPSLARFPPGVGNRQSGGAGNLSPISDAYSDISASEQAAGSRRSPKAKDTGPLIPSRASTKNTRPTYASPLSSEHLAPEHRFSNGSASYESINGSPRSASGSVPQRKPTGPRPITSSGSFSPTKTNNSIKENRYRESPGHVGYAQEDIAV